MDKENFLLKRNFLPVDIKVKYPTFHDQQQYLLECFLFFPKELEAVKLEEFYSHLWEVVRLHKPQVMLGPAFKHVPKFSRIPKTQCKTAI